MVITCDNVCELLLMERRVTGKPSCTVRGGGKAGNIRTCRLTYHHKRKRFCIVHSLDISIMKPR